MRVVTIHQPEHLSYLGFFHKVSLANVLVVLDNVLYEKNYFQNRNRILDQHGNELWLTVPVRSKTELLKDMLIAPEYSRSVRRKNVKSIDYSYKKAPLYDKYRDAFLSVYDRDFEYLAEYNIELLKWLLGVLRIDIEIIKASELDVYGSKTQLLQSILKATEADLYISGKSGRDYLDLELMSTPVQFQSFVHPVYPQCGRSSFTPFMSVIDALFNVGPEIMNEINNCNRYVRKERQD